MYKQFQLPLAIASNLVFPISVSMRTRDQPNTDTCRLSEVHLHFTHAFASRQVTRPGGSNVNRTHRFHPHAATSAFPRWVDARFSASGAVITRTDILAPLVGLSAALAANFDVFGPPSDMNALVPAHDAAPTRALIVTLRTNTIRQ